MEAPGGASSDRTMGVFRLDLIDVDKYVLGTQRCSCSGHTFGCRFGFGLKRRVVCTPGVDRETPLFLHFASLSILTCLPRPSPTPPCRSSRPPTAFRVFCCAQVQAWGIREGRD